MRNKIKRKEIRKETTSMPHPYTRVSLLKYERRKINMGRHYIANKDEYMSIYLATVMQKWFFRYMSDNIFCY